MNTLKTLFLAICVTCLTIVSAIAQKAKEEEVELSAEQVALVEKLSKLKYQEGVVDFGHDIELNVPKGYKFLNKEDAKLIVVDLWGNVKNANVEGMLVQEDYTPFDDGNWAFVLNYEDCGYIKDDDADKVEDNKERKAAGVGEAHILGWASKPFYDKANKCLHWAKSIKFEDSEDTTLNYDVRVLGRKGLLSLNAVATSGQLVDVKKHIPDIMNVAKFKKGSTYFDFDKSTDKVAAYTVGGLVAGKVLAKVGMFAFLLKYIKLIAIAVFAFFGAMRNKIAGLFGRKKKDSVMTMGDDPLA
jgi:uncharacterized membrane-anchored protein